MLKTLSHEQITYNLEDLTCSLLTGRPEANNCSQALYDNAFALWKVTWENVIFPNGFVSDCFFNAQTILVLHRDLDVASVAIFNYYDMNQVVHQHASYLRGYRELGILGHKDRFMTIEYICAAPQWRRRNLQFGKVLVGLAQQAFRASDADYVFGTARIDHGIDKVGPGYGYRSYGEINRYGLHCALMVNSKKTMREYPEPEIVELTKKLWSTVNANQKQTSTTAA